MDVLERVLVSTTTRRSPTPVKSEKTELSAMFENNGGTPCKSETIAHPNSGYNIFVNETPLAGTV